MPDKPAQSHKIRYLHGDQALLSQVKPLWEKLNQYHCVRSEHFREHYKAMTFENRCNGLLRKAAGGQLRVDLAVEEVTGLGIGYVISTVNAEKVGEVESVYVEEAYRRNGVGDQLMRNALAWMDQNGAASKQVEVSVGNEVAWTFYRRFGFMPRKTLLKQKR
jgi:ribosomal protein S18 acetylase RimI-like enzyme